MKLTNEHIEEQILLMLDGELSETDTAALLTWIGQHPEHGPLLDAYRSAYLEAEQDMIFPDKESLMQQETPVVVPFRQKRRVWIRAAAALVAGVCITAAGYLFLHRVEPAEPGSMVASQPKAIQIPVIPAPDTIKTVAIQLPVTTHHPAQPVSPVKVRHKVITQGQPPVAAQPGPVQQHQIEVEALAMMEGSSFTVAQSVPANSISWKPSGNTAAVQAPEMPSSWGPVKGESLDGINELVSRVQAIRNNIAGKAKSLKHATFVLRLGEKEIAIGK